jgi:dimethylglycine dehydrogenase
MFALNSMRVEKGYRTWKGDLSTDYTMLEAGLERWVQFDKPQDFIGKAALLAQRDAGVEKRFVTMIVETGAHEAPYMSTVLHEGEVVGETTSCDRGHRVGKSVALGTVRADLATAGSVLEINIFGHMCKAVVQDDKPLWDPENERLRA